MTTVLLPAGKVGITLIPCEHQLPRVFLRSLLSWCIRQWICRTTVSFILLALVVYGNYRLLVLLLVGR